MGGAVGALVLLACVGLASGMPGAPLRPAGPPQGITLTGDPTDGPAPLEVQFSLTLPAGGEPELNWNFGDGATLNGSNSSDLRPVHLYRAAGTFTCEVTADYGPGPVNSSLTIRVRPSAPAVSVTISPSSGRAPLTVWLNGTAQGGSGTYLSYVWSFGNGQAGSGPSVRYTYVNGGTFQANLTVVDSANVSGTGSATVRVTGGPSTNGHPGNAPVTLGPISLTAPVVGVILLGVAAVVVGTVAWTRRTRTRPDGLVPPLRPEPGPTPSGPAVAPIAPPPARPTVPGSPALTRPAAPSRPVPEGVENPARLTHQLLRHLAGLPRLLPGELATRSYTQAGMAASLEAGQSAVSRILRRLVAAGVVTVETRHIRDGDRRVRVYLLTDRGERLGRALRELPKNPDPDGAGSPEDLSDGS